MRATDPESARAHQILGETYAVLHNTDGAEKEYREALRLRPETPGVHLELGELYAGVSQWGKAETEFRSEAKLQPGDAEAAFWLGNSLLQQGKVKEARLELARANELQPWDGGYSLCAWQGGVARVAIRRPRRRLGWHVIGIIRTAPLASQAHFGWRVSIASAAMRPRRMPR